MTDEVMFDVTGAVGWIVLNRPSVRNALNVDMVTSISSTLTAWANEDSIALVAIDGAGAHGLCAGGDLRRMRDSAIAGDGACAEFFRSEYRMNAQIARFGKPIVAIMDGLVMGAGVGLSSHAGIRVVTDRTRLAMPEVAIGLAPDVGATWLLSRAPDELGTWMALTGSSVTGADAVHCGLADVVVAHRHLDRLRRDLAACTNASEVWDAVNAIRLPSPESELAENAEWITECFGHDEPQLVIEALRSHPDARALECADAVERQCPLALAVSLQALRRATRLASLEAALEQEFRTSCNLTQRDDFAEGVRAVIVDKDRQPRWHPTTLAKVRPADVTDVLDRSVHGNLGLPA